MHLPRFTVEWLESRTLLTTTIFTIDPALSSITLSAEAFGFDLDAQGTGSLKAFYTGSIVADVTSTTIQFLGGSDIDGVATGNFDPDNAPAVYAGEGEGPFGIHLGDVAIRNLTLDITSAALAITGGNFTSASETLAIKTGTLNYDAEGVGSGDENLAGTDGPNNTTAASTIGLNEDGVSTLTIPINITLEPDGVDAELTLRGTIVATSTGTAPFVDANGIDTSGGAFAADFIVDQDTTIAAVDPGLTVSDVDDTSLVSGQIILSGAVDPGETLSVTTTNTGITASFNASSGALTLTGTAPLANYQQVLRSLKYTNPAADPTAGDRTISITLNDGDDDGPTTISTITVFDPNVLTLSSTGKTIATFTDADGTLTTVTYKGGGSATLRFAGATQQTVGARAISVTGPGTVSLVSSAVTNPGALDKFTFKTLGGDGFVTVGNFTSGGSIATLGGKTVDLAGTVAVNGRIGAATFRNVTSSAITAGSILKLTIAGNLNSSTITLTDAAGVLPALGATKVTGQILNSTINSSGTIVSVKAAGLVNSTIYAGRVGSDRFPDALADLPTAAAIGKVTLGSATVAGPAFDNSVIAASRLGTIKLGLVDTDNSGAPLGVTADTLGSLAATNGAGEALRLRALSDPASLQDTLQATGFTFGDLQIRIV